MTAVLAASAGALATAPAVLVTLVAALVLVTLRAWTQIVGLVLTKQITLLLDSAIGGMVGLFVILVAVRFVTVG